MLLLPLRTDSPLRRTPWMNWGLIFANVVVFIFQNIYRGFDEKWMLNPLEPNLAHYITYAFLHETGPRHVFSFPWHLVGNMLFLYIFGNNVNDKLGHVGYLAFYLGGAVAAGIVHVLTSSAPVLGASGGVAAVTGAYLALLPRSNITLVYFFILIGAFEIPSMYFIILSFAKDLFLGVSGGRGVAYTAHVGGTVFGFVVCMGLLFTHLLARDPMDFLSMVQRWNRRRQYRGMVRTGYDPFGQSSARPGPPSHDPAGPPPLPDPALLRIGEVRAEIAEAIAHDNLPLAARTYLDLLTLDPRQVLSRAGQLDIANQLAHQNLYPQAAHAYERFLEVYPTYDQIEQVQLMLGLIYSRYLPNHPRAIELLLKSSERLRNDGDKTFALEEIAHLRSQMPRPANPPA